MWIFPNKDTLIQCNFPEQAAGRIAEVFYTIFYGDGTVHTSKTNVDVIEFGKGSYGVSKTFMTEENYSIYWQIGDEEMVASEELHVRYITLDPKPRPVVKFA